MPTDLARLEAIFSEALAQPTPGERAAFLDRACGDDAELRRQIDRLLAHHDTAGAFLVPRDVTIPPSPSIPEKIGAQIGCYKLLEQIGEGGFGVVFMAEQEYPVRRRVALKIVKLGMDTRQVVARFETERQALAMMDHPCVAKVLDGGATEAGRPYFVMELVKGTPITTYCDQYKLSVQQRLMLFEQVCQAVQHAHQKGIIHRDLKPSNVLVAQYDGKPVPKVIDFGVAKAAGQQLTERTMFTGFGDVIGTVEYMSPEQAEVNQLDVDTRSDIYSLGVLLYELLTGTTPLEHQRARSAALMEMLRVVRDEEPPCPSARLSTIKELPHVAAHRGLEPQKLTVMVKGELDWIVMKALEKDRNRRYETASGFARDIERYLHDEPVAACPPSRLYRLRKLVRRNRVVCIASGTVVAALVIGLGLASWSFLREREARRRSDASEKEQARLRQRAEEHERRAVAEAARSRAVATFMKDMMHGADPFWISGQDTTVLRQILDNTAGRMRDLDDQPEAQAEICAALASTYLDLREWPRAAETHRQTAEIYKRLHGSESMLYAYHMCEAARALRHMKQLEEAERMGREALATLQRTAPDASQTVVATVNLAYTLKDCGKLDEAEALFRKAIELRVKFGGKQHSNIAGELNMLGAINQMRGRLSEAEAMFRQSIALYTQQGVENPYLAETYRRLGNVLRDQGKREESETMHRRALEVNQKLYGVNHPNVTDAMRTLANTLRKNQQPDEADALQGKASELEQARHPEALEPLRAANFSFSSRALPDETWEVTLDDQPIRDLSPLRGQPISRLSLRGTKVTDLSPLSGLPLKYLGLQRTEVTDLRPLAGMPLESLHLSGAKVIDISPLRGLRLRQLHMGGCRAITDLSPLEQMTSLAGVTLPPTAQNYEFLRGFPNLARISFRYDAARRQPDRSAPEFWKEYDQKHSSTRPTQASAAASKPAATTSISK